MSHCIECHQSGHLIMQCPQFHENLMKPSPGTCARCGGPGTFLPYVHTPEQPAHGKTPKTVARIEASFICGCCSAPQCPHRRNP